uniref:Purinergic receptor P2Y13 n=1 Tax=Oryzias melastigma TaxID=30732 RepID=A0A3B3DFT2_ORYME
MQNNSSHLSTSCTLSNAEITQILVAYLFFFSFPFAFLLNAIAAWVSFHLPLSSTFIVYLKTLVGADLLMTLTIPSIAASMLPGAALEVRSFSCRYAGVIFFTSMYTSITLMGLISLDRFFKIVRPLGKGFGQNITTSIVLSSLVWVVLFGGLPNIILTNRTVPTTQISGCMILKSPAGIRFHEKTTLFLNVFFWIVSVTIAVCYICIVNKVIQSYRNSGSNNSQGKQKVKLRVFLVIIVFFVSFGPYHIVRIPYTFQQVSSSSTTTCSQIDIQIKLAKELTHWLSTTNICMDPLLYVFLCREFKEQLMALMKKVNRWI